MSLFNENGLEATGRSCSQRSIHDYPEHLNPFYEDENHKRLRFWKLGSDDKKSGRRNSSFSIDGLKGLWSFKTFQWKKKSSILGINKTSESPPLPRRNDDYYGSQSKIGHTVNVGLESNFQRGAGYRCSLQNLNSNSRPGEDVFLVRNHRYRSTMQPGRSNESRYQNNGTVTPTPRSRFNQSDLSRGSSQISVNSGNPFEYLDTISHAGSPDGVSIRRSGRKKRRAPQPPISPAQMFNETIATVEKKAIKSSVEEEAIKSSGSSDKIVDISNLTAEIESFVHAADTDKENIEGTSALHSEFRIDKIESTANEKNPEYHRESSRQSPESNEYYPQDEQNDVVTLEKLQNLGSMDADVSNNSERCKKSPVKIFIRAPTVEEPIPDEKIETIHSIDIIQEAADSKMEITHAQEKQIIIIEPITGQNEKIVIVQVEPVNTDPISVEPASTVTVNVEPIKDLTNTKDDHCSNTVPTSAAVEFILENDPQNEPNTSLRITESTDNLPNASESTPVNKEDEEEEVQLRPKPSAKIENEKTKDIGISSHMLKNFNVRQVPLKLDSPKAAKKHSPDGETIEKEKPIPPHRRRSVKEIIDSINKTQSRLKINQKEHSVAKDKVSPTPASSSSFSSKLLSSKNTFADRNLNDSTEKQYDEKQMFSDVAAVNNNETRDSIPLFVEEFNGIDNNRNNNNNNNNNDNTNNGVIFEKCVVRSGKKWNEPKKSNVEWNPVPKPRRHRQSQQESIN